MFDRPVFGWLPWPPKTSKKFVLSGNVLTIRWSLANTKKIMFEKIFPTFHRVAKNLKNLTLKNMITFRFIIILIIISTLQHFNRFSFRLNRSEENMEKSESKKGNNTWDSKNGQN
jgi:hypothetical protein